MTDCPCCSHQMLRHIHHHQVYWFCRNCWQEMPVLEQHDLNLVPSTLKRHLALLKPERSLVMASRSHDFATYCPAY